MPLDELPQPGDPDAGGEGEEGALSAPAQITSPDNQEQIAKLVRWSDPLETVNICDELDETLLGQIGMSCCRQYDIDVVSRKQWLDDTSAAMKLAQQIIETKSFPWPAASNIVYPIVASAAIQFAARCYPAIVSGPDVVKGVVYGSDAGIPAVDPATQQPIKDQNGNQQWIVPPGAKRARADRIGGHMSWQFLEEMAEWEEETDKLVHSLPIVGCAFRKSWFDSELRRNMDVLVLAEHLVVNYWAKSIDSVPRITEEMKFYPAEMEAKMRSGLWLEHDFGTAAAAGEDEDAPHDFLEQHRLLDLDQDGYPEPYIVTIHKETQKVERIVARFDAENIRIATKTGKIASIEPVQFYTKYDFLPALDGGFYGFGFGKLLRPLNEGVNTALNQLFDAGTLQNTGGGFIGRGLSLKTGSLRRAIGEWTIVNVPGSKIREAIVPLTHPGASDTLFKLLGFLIEAAKELSSNAEVLAGRQPHANMPASTTLALIEQGLKVFTGIYKRIYRANTSNFGKHYRLNRLYLDDSQEYRRGDDWREIRREDYEEGAAVQPVSDPSMVSDMQMLARAEFLGQYKDDRYCDGMEIRRRIFTAAKMPDVEALLMKQAPPDPALLLKTEELRLKEIATKAKALADMTLAIKNLADADAKGAEQHMRWIEAEMTALEKLVGGIGNGGAEPGAGGPVAGDGAGGPLPGADMPGGDGLGLQALEA